MMKSSGEEVSNNNENDVANNSVGKLLIVRHQQSDFAHNAAIAAANAIQEPVLNTAMLSRFGSADSSIRVPHLLDILLFLHRLFRTDSSDTPVHSFLSGTESEGDEFLTILPKVFFINCVVGSGFGKLGKANYVHVAFPVILKRGQYYIIMGEANTPVYRVLNPKDLFFTPRGKLCLRYLLNQNLGEGEHLDFYEPGDGSVETYCVPHFVDQVSDRWDFCAEGDIEELLHCPLVQQPIVPPSHRASVQIVNLDDTVNIVDIKYPETIEMCGDSRH